MSQLLTIVLERQNYVEASSAHYPWKWRLTNHGIHHVLTPWQYFHVSMMSEWLRQVAGWKIRPYLSGHHWFLAVDTEKQFPSFQSMENEPSSLKVMISSSPEGRVIEWREQHLLRDTFQPFLSACLEMGRKSLFANISLLSPCPNPFYPSQRQKQVPQLILLLRVTARESSWKQTFVHWGLAGQISSFPWGMCAPEPHIRHWYKMSFCITITSDSCSITRDPQPAATSLCTRWVLVIIPSLALHPYQSKTHNRSIIAWLLGCELIRCLENII